MDESADPCAPPVHALNESTSTTTVHFCFLCDKPFANESSRDRHQNYCGRRTRNRPRSCRACNTAKTKCSFEVPCSRCSKKSIECLYDDPVAAGSRATSKPSLSAPNVSLKSRSRPLATLANEALPAEDAILSNHTFTDDIAAVDTPMVGSSGDNVDLGVPKFLINDSLMLDGLLPSADGTLDQHRYSVDFLVNSNDIQIHSPGNWCEWMSRGVSISVVTEDPIEKPDSNPLAIFRPHAQHDADNIIQSLRSFPTRMLRRETFPWFIHPLTHLLSTTPTDALPEALSTCMSIAHMFASRTSETKHILRRAIRTEYSHFMDEIYHLSKFELLAALQACMIYLIMFMIDQSIDAEGRGSDLVQALHDLTAQFKKVFVASAGQTKPSHSSASWEDWIFVESQRRLLNLWFLVGCVVCVKTGIVCDPSQSYRNILLPSSKTLWEAPTQSDWESEYEASCICQISGLDTLGDLIDLQQSEYSPPNARKLDQWNAGVDNLGSMLNLVGTMV